MELNSIPVKKMGNFKGVLMKSVMRAAHNFALEPSSKVPRTKFNRSHGYKTTFDAGYLVPIFCDEVIPGDTQILRTHTMARLATPIFPFMDNLFADIFYFFVPMRLLWSNFEKFHGAQDNPGDSTAYVYPALNNTGVGYSSGSIYDYFGLPVGVALNVSTYRINALPFRAYNLIWNTWFRDENLQNSEIVNLGNGPDTLTDYNLLRRGKRHDYFTSALPFPQKGTAPQIPVRGVGIIGSDGTQPNFSDPAGAPVFTDRGLSAFTVGANNTLGITGAAVGGAQINTIFGSNTGLEVQANSGGLYSLVNEIRQGAAVQQLLELDSRGGTRYVELLRAHWDVISPDFRLQRPEFLGGGEAKINVNPIAQTSSTDVTTPQGNLAAVGTFSHGGDGFTHSFVEHGYIIGLISVRADLTYQNGLDKMWTKSTRYETYYPELANLGEQVVNSMELDCNGTGTDFLVFGYQPRYDEYRYKRSQITGLFRSGVVGSIDQWHLAQDFGGVPPTLGPVFIQDDPPIDRVIAVPSQPHFLLDVYFDYSSVRPMPMYSIPGLARF